MGGGDSQFHLLLRCYDFRLTLMKGRNNWVLWSTKIVGRMLMSLSFCLERNGIENLPKKSAFILLPKHQRWVDIPLLGLATPRPLYYIAKHELFRNSLSNWFIRSLGGIPLNRKRPLESRGSIKAMVEFLEKGEGVVIFPEGTYFRNAMGPGHTGIVRYVISRLTLPFIPVGINYSGKGFRTLVRINFGKPIYTHSEISANIFLDDIMKEIAQLSGLS